MCRGSLLFPPCTFPLGKGSAEPLTCEICRDDLSRLQQPWPEHSWLPECLGSRLGWREGKGIHPSSAPEGAVSVSSIHPTWKTLGKLLQQTGDSWFLISGWFHPSLHKTVPFVVNVLCLGWALLPLCDGVK